MIQIDFKKLMKADVANLDRFAQWLGISLQPRKETISQYKCRLAIAIARRERAINEIFDEQKEGVRAE